MALVVYEGTLGGGKSYHAVQHALHYLARGGRVYSNIELVQDSCIRYCRSRFGVDLQWDAQFRFLNASDIARLHEVVKGGTKGAPVLAILDEIHLYHNSRDWSHASRGLLQWLTQSRKLYVDIICITQHRNNLDKQWVRLVARYFRFRDLRACKMPGLGIRFPFFECLSVELDSDGKTVVDRKWERFDKDVFGCYSSDQLFDGCVDGFAGSGLTRVELQKAKKGKVGVKVYGILLGVLLLAVVCVFFWFRNRPDKKFDAIRSHKSRVAVERDVRDRERDSPPPARPVVPSDPEWVSCDGWTARDGQVVSGYSSAFRLTFRGVPDRVEDGLPVYAYRRGQRAY